MTKSFSFLPLCVSILVALGCTKEAKRGAEPSITGEQVKRTGRDKETACESGTAGLGSEGWQREREPRGGDWGWQRERERERERLQLTHRGSGMRRQKEGQREKRQVNVIPFGFRHIQS